VKDVFAIPDYDAYLKPLRDTRFAEYKTGKKTQLLFRFERVIQCLSLIIAPFKN
jgi:hypothetical protein